MHSEYLWLNIIQLNLLPPQQASTNYGPLGASCTDISSSLSLYPALSPVSFYRKAFSVQITPLIRHYLKVQHHLVIP
ncbi:hypothetical protein CLV24_10639 [Pontibacter ummariensis]|uniref:Uncharacterized protein n=1 Tax=Pontibacter ummariensis TaxID=1610492 RepID=A0A239E9D7_9BACT|nr:hypothetical protein CLV24_10639 [Pontibacter ummariensis]SNS40643.1 hypothetical protein SAMN06296052_10639 [Pontibacter ummariensis]